MLQWKKQQRVDKENENNIQITRINLTEDEKMILEHDKRDLVALRETKNEGILRSKRNGSQKARK